MALTRRNYPVTLPALQESINRLFEDMFPEPREDFGMLDWRPRVDTYEKEDSLIIKADLPGIKKDDVSIDVNNNLLTIKGERHDEEAKSQDYYRCERFYGSFQRAFTLPNNVDSSKIEASFKDGVLEITLPKTQESQAKKIEIR